MLAEDISKIMDHSSALATEVIELPHSQQQAYFFNVYIDKWKCIGQQ